MLLNVFKSQIMEVVTILVEQPVLCRILAVLWLFLHKKIEGTDKTSKETITKRLMFSETF